MSWNITALISLGRWGGRGSGAETQLLKSVSVEAELQLDRSIESRWGRGKQRI